MTEAVRDARTWLLALSLVVAFSGTGAAQGPPASISISDLPESVEEGSTVSFTVTVVDVSGAPVVGYLGTVHFSSSLAGTLLPEDYTFGPEDRGSHEFSLTARRSGAQTLRVTDVTSGLRGWERTRVEATTVAAPAAGDPMPALAADERRPREVNVGAGGHLYIVAHQDDDLLFMNPDVEGSIRKGLRVRTLFVTAAGSTPGSPPGSWQARENAVFNAYPAMAQVAKDWTCTTQTFLTNKVVKVCTLNPQPLVSVAFMRLQDGSVASLWARDGGPPFYTTPVPSLTSVDGVSTYTRAELTATLAAVLADFGPDRVGIQDATLAYGPDHTDHVAAALFALEAHHSYPRNHQLRVYRDYSVYVPWTNIPSPEIQNLSPAQHAEKVAMMEAYGGAVPVDSDWDRWCWRWYAIERLVNTNGRLMGPGGKCLDVGNNPADGTPAAAVACSAASTRWTIADDGHIILDSTVATAPEPVTGLRGRREGPAAAKPVQNRERHPAIPVVTLAAKCLVLDPDGVTVRVSACADGSPSQSWTLLSNGQIRGREATCLTVGADGVTVQASLCQADTSTDKYRPVAAQRWVQQMEDSALWSSQFSDGDLGNPPAAYAGSFRMADVNGDGRADACIRLAGGVFCALNAGAGSFGSRQLYSAAFADPDWLPDAYGSTLQLADINGDGKADLCGRGGSGIVCATANVDGTAFVNARVWSSGTDFADAQGWAVSASYYGSIHLADVNGDGYADVCGRGPNGVVCALNNKAGGFAPATLWIADFTDALGWQAVPYGSTLQFADVNGDGKADVCGRGPAGVRCATANASGTGFTDARPWSLRTDFSDADGWGAAAASYGSLRLADFNGDGYADLCGRSAGGVVCAFSNSGAFDVAQPVMPRDYTDAAGWGTAVYGATIQFGDLGGDGRRDVCGRGPAGLVCAKAP